MGCAAFHPSHKSCEAPSILSSNGQIFMLPVFLMLAEEQAVLSRLWSRLCAVETWRDHPALAHMEGST